MRHLVFLWLWPLAVATTARAQPSPGLCAAARANDTAKLGKSGALGYAEQDLADTPPLAVCAAQGHAMEALQLVIQRGAKVNLRDRDGRTALHVAAREGDRAMVTWLLAHGAAIDAGDLLGNTALVFAAREVRRGVVEDLLAAGADPWRGEAFYVAANGLYDPKDMPQAEAIVELFLAKTKDVDHLTSDGRTALLLALASGRRHAFEFWLAHGAKLDVRDNKDRGALHVACEQYGSPELVDLLIRKGLDVTAQDRDGQTPLHVAAAGAGKYGERERTAIIDRLLAAKAAIDARDHHGRTPLLVASTGAVAAQLLAHGANPGVVADDGTTALMSAARRKDTEVVRTLIAAHVPTALRDAHGETALDLARRVGATDAAKLLAPATPPDPAHPRYPFLSMREITPADLDGLTVEELVIARNEIFARHGYAFQHADLAAYFANQTWYHRDPRFRDDSLSDLERANVRVLLATEKAHP